MQVRGKGEGAVEAGEPLEVWVEESVALADADGPRAMPSGGSPGRLREEGSGTSSAVRVRKRRSWNPKDE